MGTMGIGGALVTSGGGIGSVAGQDHALLDNLDYASAGHTDFAGTAVANTFTANQTIGDTYGLVLSDTTAAGDGVIYKGANRFIHNFHHPTGDTAVPDGYNIFIGENAGNFTVGSTAVAVTHGSYNVGIGADSLQSLTAGVNNMAFGYQALKAVAAGSYNTAIGYQAGLNVTGSYNIILGRSAANGITSGTYNICTFYILFIF